MIGKVNATVDGHGPAQDGAGIGEEALTSFAGRWRLWLNNAGLREMGEVEPSPNSGRPAEMMQEQRHDGPSECYRVLSGTMKIGTVGRYYGMRADGW